jgi:hypothetical protein
MITEDEQSNFELFRDCVSSAVIEKLAPDNRVKAKKRSKGRKHEHQPDTDLTGPDNLEQTDAADLADFIEVFTPLQPGSHVQSDTRQYLAVEIFTSLPDEVRSLCYANLQDDSDLAARYELPLDRATLEALLKPLPLTISDSLCSYGLISDASSVERFLEPILGSFVASAASPPPEFTPSLATARPSGCEICGREHLPLTYHHLIPRQIHAKAVKRGWHKEWELNKVAWLCRACHNFVHRIATNEELARHLYDVDLLMEREDVQKWATWIRRVRWKAR